MEVREDRQRNPVLDEVGALVAVSRPVIVGVLQSISQEVVSTFSERDQLPLRMLGRLRKRGDGDCGIAFEYAVHNAVISADPIVVERVADALNKCRIARGNPASILFAIEKAGAQQLISTEISLITENSRLLTGQPGQPVKLKKYLNTLAAAFRRPGTRPNLPQSIRGLWKADLFLGSTEADHWVGTTVKINPVQLEPAKGLRIAIVPSLAGRSDGIRFNEQKNLVICPMPHDGSFMQIFYEGWRIVQALCERDFNMPREVDIPNPTHREVARIFVERRDFPIAEVIEATRKFAQPELLTTSTEVIPDIRFATTVLPRTSTIITPFPHSLITPQPPCSGARRPRARHAAPPRQPSTDAPQAGIPGNPAGGIADYAAVRRPAPPSSAGVAPDSPAPLPGRVRLSRGTTDNGPRDAKNTGTKPLRPLGYQWRQFLSRRVYFITASILPVGGLSDTGSESLSRSPSARYTVPHGNLGGPAKESGRR